MIGSKIGLAALTLAISAGPLLANNGRQVIREQVQSVPEIDASAGLLAIAAVMVTLAFVWERRRRAA